MNTNTTVVVFSTPMLSTNYRVALTATSTGALGGNNSCSYFAVTNKTLAGFTVNVRDCQSNGGANVDSTVNLDYIAISSQ